MIAEGTRLGHYTITAPIGSGGMGAVYEAVDERLRRRVAIKILPPRLALDGESLQRFRQEARAASALNHPNIVHIYDIDEAYVEGDTLPYIVMELVEGETLRALMSRGAAKPELLSVLTQVADAMAKAHECGIVHRDLKPENIMVHRDGYAKVVDFGLAKLVETPALPVHDGETEQLVTAAGSIRGTAAYMSPEQARGEAADARSDVFTLGCILYEILAGRRPFGGESPIETLYSVVHHEPERTGDPRWDPIVSRCLAKKPSARYANARELVSDLRSAPAPSATPVKRRRRPYAAIAIALAVIVLVIASAAWLLSRKKTPVLSSVAVLPLRNVNGDPELDYISDGVTESVMAALAETTSLRVMSRASVFRFKNANASPVDAGRALGVDAVLAGEVVPRGKSLVINAELIDVGDGARLWGHRYETGIANVLAVQEAISRDVAAKLGRQRAGDAPRRTTEDPEAYRLYLKGRYHWNKRSADGLARAVEHFSAALDRDPTYARAWVGLADSYALMEQYAGVPSAETCPKAKAAALRAIAIDPGLAEPHATLGLLYAHCEWKWPESEQEFRRALALDGNYATTHHWYALHLGYRAELARALEEARRAQELDPLSLIANNAVAVVQAYARNWDAVLAQCDRNLRMDPSFVVTYLWIGRARRAQGRHDEAIAALEKAVDLSQGRSLEALGDLGNAYAVAGRREDALRVLDRLQRADAASAHYPIAALYAGLGENERAIAALEEAVAAHSWFLVQVNVDDAFDPLRGDARFRKIADEIFGGR